MRGADANRPYFERLSALDSLFLDLEDGANHMHVAALLLFEGGGLRRADGTADLERLRRYTASVLGGLPRWRQRLARVPFLRDPVWIDDDRFDLDAHIRSLTVAPRGDESALRDCVGRLLSQELDRRRPLWELWALDGLADDRIAIVAKVHHCMVDGIAGIGLMGALLRPAAEDAVPDAPEWTPRPAPSGNQLLEADLKRRLRAPVRLWKEAKGLVQHRSQRVRAVLDDLSGATQLASTGIVPTSRTALNPPRVGPRRSVDWVSHDLARVKAVKRAAHATVNDVVLATVAGAARRFLRERGEAVDHLRFRVAVPVALPREDAWGNQVSIMLAHLPLHEAHPRRRLEQVRDTMSGIKATGESQALALGERLADWTVMSAMTLAVRAVIRLRPYNLIVTNIPGPQMPLYLLGSRMVTAVPVVPLYGNQAAGIALLSYDGTLTWGVDADRDRLPDMRELVHCIDASFEELAEAWQAVSGSGKHLDAR